jgi:putative hydrolase of HD superfamily
MEEAHEPVSAAVGLLDLARCVAKLKFVPRTGWLDRGLAAADVESVADHSFGVAMLAWAAAVERQAGGAGLRPERVLLLALVHDLAEAQTGDHPPYDRSAIPAADDVAGRKEFLERRHVRDAASTAMKRRAEDAAMQDLLRVLPGSAATALAALWEELRAGTSPEARFVKQVDQLETFLQSRHYLAVDPEIPVGSFQREVLETIDDPLLQSIRDAALAETRDEPS